MSGENVELTKRAYAAFAAGGVEAVLTYFASDAVIYPFPEWPDDSEYRGHDGVRALFAEWTENFDEFEMHNHEVREVGDRVLALGETAGRIKDSSVPIRQPLGVVFELRDGMIEGFVSFLTWREALEAAGLSE